MGQWFASGCRKHSCSKSWSSPLHLIPVSKWLCQVDTKYLCESPSCSRACRFIGLSCLVSSESIAVDFVQLCVSVCVCVCVRACVCIHHYVPMSVCLWACLHVCVWNSVFAAGDLFAEMMTSLTDQSGGRRGIDVASMKLLDRPVEVAQVSLWRKEFDLERDKLDDQKWPQGFCSSQP